ncbi:MAG TPA: serine protease, partial [Alphaproteobacteria bacterium]|nr:serine protease [Alphaproteobacteria bacterium]
MKRLFILFSLLALLAPSLHAADVVPQSKTQIALTFAPVVKQVSPAVVNIYTRAVVRGVESPIF